MIRNIKILKVLSKIVFVLNYKYVKHHFFSIILKNMFECFEQLLECYKKVIKLLLNFSKTNF